MNPAEVFAEPLVDLAIENSAFAGIYTPRSSLGAAKVGVTEQFLERAEEYHRNYLDLDYWRFLLGNAIAAGGISDPDTVIDIGSGSGNSVIPLADRFLNAHIVATDISPQLLAILRDFLRKRPDAERFALVCVDATAAAFRESRADLAVGAAILHHVLDPSRVIASCFKALKPGGWAIFFEPFEAGNTILKLTYQSILARAAPAERAGPALQFLERMVTDYTIRQRPKSDPIFRELDDKWLFTRTYFERIKLQQGWDELITYGLNVCATALRNQVTVQLKLGLQSPPEVLPQWAWAMIDEMDAGISDDLRQEWVQEGAVLLRKPLAA
jgi:ubiquinone/menaquinone biosynthesis C-methylase UbiE